MIGLMCGGGALVTASIGRALQGHLTDGRLAVYGGLGAVAFGAGVMQKETSICVLAVRPKISGEYISSTRVGAVRNVPDVVARTR